MLVGAGTLAAVGGAFAAVAVIPIAIVVDGGQWPIAVVAVTDVVIVLLQRLKSLALLPLLGGGFGGSSGVDGSWAARRRCGTLFTSRALFNIISNITAWIESIISIH